MKVKPSRKPGRVLVEVDPKDASLLARTGPAVEAFAIRKVLVPVDFSEGSRKALAYALPLVRQFGARLALVNVVPANYYVGSEFGPVDFPLPEAEWRENSRRELKELAEAHAASGLTVETFTRQGQAAHEIAACALEWEADLLVLSTHGRTGLRHVLMGSVAENVVRYAPCPVLVVREHGHEFLRSIHDVG